jgi:hypothetical protein
LDGSLTGPASRASRPHPAVGLAAVVVALALVGLGCSSSSSRRATTTRPGSSTTRDPATTDAPSTTTPASSTSSTPGPTPPTGPSGTTTTGGTGTAACLTGQLSGAVQTGQGAAGHVITPLTLTNHGGTCQLTGYPGVSLIDASGHQIGVPATRATRPVIAVTLAPGASAQTELESQNQGLSPGPCWLTSSSIKVYPPGQLAWLSVPGAFQVCGAEFTVTPMGPA